MLETPKRESVSEEWLTHWEEAEEYKRQVAANAGRTEELSKEEKEDYKKSLIKFRSKQQDKFSVQGYSDYIAFQVFTMDRIMYWHSVKNMGLDKLRGFKKAFAEFEKAAMPKP